MDPLIKVAAPAGCGIPALIEPHKPSVGVTGDDLAARMDFLQGKLWQETGAHTNGKISLRISVLSGS
jgi:hypothetical protein